MKRFKDNLFPIVLVITAATWTVALSKTALQRHLSYQSNLWDLGWYEQIIWNTAHGRILAHSIRGIPTGNFLEEHITFIPILVAPLYRLIPKTELVLVVQSLALAFGSLLLYPIASHILRDQLAACLVCLAYFVSPLPMGVGWFDFHPIAFVAPLLMALFLTVIKGNKPAAVLLALLALIVQEEVGLTVIAIGLLAWKWRERQLGVILITTSVTWLGTIFLFSSIYFQAGPFVRLSGYRYPMSLAPHLEILHLKWRYLSEMMVLFGLMPLFGGLALITAIPALFYNAASTFVPQLDWRYQYQAILIAPLFVASVFGIKRTAMTLEKYTGVKYSRLAVWLAGWLGAIVLFGSVALGAVTYFFLWRPSLAVQSRARWRSRAVSLIPLGATVSAGNSVGAHLAQREKLYDFPRYPFKGDWVIFDSRGLVDQGFEGVDYYQAQVDKLNHHPDYRLVADLAGVVVYQRTVR